METKVAIKPPTWFWIVSAIALLWNLLGVFAYLADAYMGEEALAALPEAQQELYETRPAWVTAAFAIAVFGGALGCIALLLRKKWASPVFILSLMAVLAQQLYVFFLSDTFEVMGNQAMVMPIVVLAIGIALVFFARSATRKNWLT
ncbi:hypothetical protein FK220_012310 [Flavobacteriaceae bacterium TP-CH-4]|uniref:Sugar transporter n=1 Tax=Pelagihabitans pacificus TaxID=2696054 RepID=A0A967AYX9_9FLAO|nr:hypothetical protein [Pelagihabitans pacificus]NHF60132.1 hypothetical protein [Pelagihabitans pacificus]